MVTNPYAQPRRFSLLSSAPGLVRPTTAGAGVPGAALALLPPGGRGEVLLRVAAELWRQSLLSCTSCQPGATEGGVAAGPVLVAVRDEEQDTVEECWAVELAPSGGPSLV